MKALGKKWTPGMAPPAHVGRKEAYVPPAIPQGYKACPTCNRLGYVRGAGRGVMENCPECEGATYVKGSPS